MITLRNITKIINGNRVLDDLSMQITPGSVTGIIGPSGGGKSTLLRCINGLETQVTGSVVVDEILLTEVSRPSVQKKVGMVFQSFHLFENMTALENITYAPMHVHNVSFDDAVSTAYDLLSTFGMKEKALAFPYDLSGGQKQRVAIARALATEPRVILFDEPTSALDIQTTKDFVGLIKTLKARGLTIVLVTHEIDLALAVTTDIIYIEHGKIIEAAPTHEFFHTQKTKEARNFLSRK